MVAAARAIASAEPQPLINDPYAAALVRAVGVDFFTKLVDGELMLDCEDSAAAELMTSVMAVRTKFFDDFFMEAAAVGDGNPTDAVGDGNLAGAAGIRQAVILASEYHPDIAAAVRNRSQSMAERWRQHGFDVDLSELWYVGERNSVVDYLTDSGWSVTARRRPEVFAEYGHTFPDTEDAAPQRNSMAVVATRQ
jgi:O-methyltransferase involved in polyketide biosynthesis